MKITTKPTNTYLAIVLIVTIAASLCGCATPRFGSQTTTAPVVPAYPAVPAYSTAPPAAEADRASIDNTVQNSGSDSFTFNVSGSNNIVNIYTGGKEPKTETTPAPATPPVTTTLVRTTATETVESIAKPEPATYRSPGCDSRSRRHEAKLADWNRLMGG